MLEASFDPRVSRSAAIHGADQYDTGQRLRLCGLPGPDELSEADGLLGLSVAAVQVHFSYDGDTQSEPVLAAWEEDRDAWISVVPDEYLTRAEPVRVNVYVYYGADGESERAKTMYEGVFTPRSRTAPNNVATEDQISWWAGKLSEVQLALSAAQTATDKASAQTEATLASAQAALDAAASANEAASGASSAANRLTRAGEALSGVTMQAVTVDSSAVAQVTLSGGVQTFYIPRGDVGPQGVQGATGATGPADVSFGVSGGNLIITTK